ncbi:uncharacterized protein LOC144903520 [Branchiostoma floridae x Branchiostoma belcheri]
MCSSYKAILLLLTLSFVGIFRSVGAYPAGDPLPAGRQARSVQSTPSTAGTYDRCGPRGFRWDLGQTRRTSNKTSRTLNIIKELVFRDPNYTTAPPANITDGLVPLLRTLNCGDLILQTVLLEAHQLQDVYNSDLLDSMRQVGRALNNLVLKLRFTLVATGELGGTTDLQGCMIPEAFSGTKYEQFRRHFLFFRDLGNALEMLEARLQARLISDCPES